MIDPLRQVQGSGQLPALIEALNAHAVVSITDANGDIVHANEKFCAVSGYSPEELIGRNHRIVRSGEHPPEFYARLWETISAGKIWQGVICNRRKDGHLYWVETTILPVLDDADLPVSYVSIRTDITSVKATEARLAEREAQARAQLQTLEMQERRYRLLAENASDVITRHDRDGRLTYASPAVTRLLGYEVEEILGRSRDDLVHPEDVDRIAVSLRKVLDRGEAAIEPYRVRRRDGEYVWIETTMRLLPAAVPGEPNELVAVSRDVSARVLAQEELRRTRERLEFVLAATPVLIYSCRAGGDFMDTFLSDNISDILGYSSQEYLETQPWNDLLHPEDRAWAEGGYEEALVAGRAVREYRLRIKDGTYRWFQDEMRLVGEAGSGADEIVGSLVDIEDRKRAEFALQRSEERVRRSHEFANLGTWEWDLCTGEVFWSEGAAQLFGHAPAELRMVYESFLALVHADDRRAVAEAVEVCLRQGGDYHVEFRVVRPDGTVRWLQEQGDVERAVDGAPLRMLGIVQDVTSRKEAELAVKDSEARYRRLMESAYDAILLGDERGRLLDANRSAAEMLGHPREELVGRTPEDFVPAQEQASFWASFDHMMRLGQTSWEGHLVTRDGGQVPVEATGSRFEHGGRPYVLGVFRDVSERLERERALLEAKAQAERASQAKSEFLSRMSHELRTPLNAILGFAQFMEADPGEPLTPGQGESVKEILRAGWHLLELINEVLDLARIEAGRTEVNLETVPLGTVLDECTMMIRPVAEGHDVELVVADLPVGTAVRADRLRLKQVFLNLLSNAVKYNRTQGAVHVHVSPGPRVRVSVRDTGPGIPAARVEELFQPFNRLGREHGREEGTGIGLVISKRLVELMGGAIGVESVEGGGSTFWVEFDAAGELPPRLTATSAATAQGPVLLPSRYTVLYVEDDPTNMRLVETLAGTFRPDVRLLGASSANLALALAQAHRPDLILLDSDLPEMGGLEILAALRADARTASVPVVAVTANAAPHDAELAAGFQAYLTKPLQTAEFQSVLERILGPVM